MKLSQKEKIEQEKKDFLEYLEESHGNVRRAGFKIGKKQPHSFARYHRQQDEVFAKNYDEIKEEARNNILDLCEDVVVDQAINEKNWKTAMYILKCQGKDRGWVEYKEFSGNNKPIIIKLEREVSDEPKCIDIEDENALTSKSNIQ